MRYMRTGAILLGAVLAVPVLGHAAPAKDATSKAATSGATHRMRGVVTSVDETSLVISRGTGTKKKEMTFALDGATRREGDIAVGSTVALRYKTEDAKKIATRVWVKQPLAQKAASSH